MENNQKDTILVTASTYPRWKDDSVPSFIQQFCERMSSFYKSVHVLVPHYKGASRHEKSGNIIVKRFRYAIPASAQDIVYGGGGVFKIKKTPIYAIKLLGLIISEFWNTLFLATSNKVAVINAHWIVPQGFLAILVKALTRKKVVVSVHGSDIFGLKGGVMTAVKRFTLKHADHVVANSSASLKACQDIYPDVKATIVPMGTDLNFFQPKPVSQELKERYGVDGIFTILFLGRLTKVKGVIYLIEALSELRKSGAQFKALIAGDGPERQHLEQLVKEHDLAEFVQFVGWVKKSEIVDFYNLGDVFVGPSLHEAFGLVFVEAQACGVPVIASRVNGIPDIVQDGKTGFLVERRSSDDIYKRLKQLHDEPELLNKMKQYGPKAMNQDFSWESVERRYYEVFESLK